MPVAIFNLSIRSAQKIDAEKGIIEGCKLAEVNKVAIFADKDGKPTQILMRPALLENLLALWKAKEEGAAHWSHRWIETGEDGIESKVATWKNFRIDGNGDLAADAYLWPTARKEAILYAAEHDPKGLMVSQVFDYSGGRDDCKPIAVHAADFVERGASTTALLAKLSQTQKTANMAEITLDDLKTLFATPEGKAMVQGCIDGHDKAADDTEAAAMESDAGVTDADKKKEDDQKPALMRAQLRIARSVARQSAQLKVDKAAILAEAKTNAAAEATAVLGKGRFISAGGEDDKTKTATAKFSAAVKELTDKGVKEGAATQAVLKGQPELYESMNRERGIFKS